MGQFVLREGEYLSLAPRFGGLEAPWDVLVSLAILLVPAVLILVLFRREAFLVRWTQAALLGGLRLVVLGVLWFVAMYRPSLVHEHEETLPSRVLVAVDRSGSMAIRDPQRPLEEGQRLAAALSLDETGRRGLAQATRGEIVRRLLEPGPVDLLGKLKGLHEVDALGFRLTLREEGKEEVKRGWEGDGTDFRPVLERGWEEVEVEGRAKYLGVVLLTDGRHTEGSYPLEAARRSGRRGVPVYAVGIGSSVPPAQLAVREVRAPEQILRKAAFRLQARVDVQGLPPQNLKVELRRRGGDQTETQIRNVRHDGKTVRHDVEFALKGDRVGTQFYEVRVIPEKGPASVDTIAPATGTTIVRVLQDKVRVLLADGEARWEHHFLAGALRRDADVVLEEVLFDPPMIGGVKKEARQDAGLPALNLPGSSKGEDGNEPLNDYDVVILGDVPPERLPLADRRRLEKFVAERGGSLVLIGGKRHMPLEYLKESDGEADPLGKMLPVRSPRKIAAAKGFLVAPTPVGESRDFLKLEENSAENRRLWSALPRHFWAVVGDPAPAAVVLAATAAAEGPETNGLPLVVEQGYGLGKVLWVGLDSTWRWRYRRGDELHHRFWGQVVRWAGVQDLLPAGDRTVRYGTRRPVYAANQEVDIAVRVLGERALPKEAKAVILRGEEKVAEVALQPLPGQPRFLEGKVAGLAPGEYRVRAELAGFPGTAGSKEETGGAAFLVASPPPPREMEDAACDWEGLRALARESGGRFLAQEEAGRVVDLLQARREVRRTRSEARPWQDPPLVWWFFAGVLGLLTLEWVGRKLVGLP